MFFRKLSLRRECFKQLSANVSLLSPTLNNVAAIKAIATESSYPNTSDLVFGAMTEYQNAISTAAKKDFVGSRIQEVDRLVDKLIASGNDAASDLERWSQDSQAKNSSKLKNVIEIWKSDIQNFNSKRLPLLKCY